MNITRLRVQNFKSFDTLDLALGNFNVLIGANASGKSNLLSVLTFVRDVVRDGLEDAVSLQGGMEYLRNFRQPRSANTILEVLACDTVRLLEILESHPDELDFAHYRLELQRKESPEGYAVVCESLTRGSGSRHELLRGIDRFLDTAHVVGRARRTNNEIASEARSEDILRKLERGLLAPKPLSKTESFLGTPTHMLALVGGASSKTFSSTFTPIFDFDIESLKQTAQPLSGKKDLAEDGSNLALVLRNLLRDETKRRRFSNLMTTLLPFAEDLRVHERADPSLRITLKESYAEDRLLPASLLSDGTLQAVALIVALYFDDRPVIAFEEPTRGLHPKLISQLVQMMREVATEKQLLVTTHNPELMKHVGLENVYLVSRNDEGFTHVTKPADKKTVQTFLEHDLGVDDLFVQNLL